MKYNNSLTPLPLPEYGRSVQNMVDICKTIEDREERNHCAHSIIRILLAMFPDRSTPEDNNKVLWDHLAIMSNFELDIDYPVEVIQKEKMNPIPETIPYPKGTITYRHYGRIVEEAIQLVADMEPGEEREHMALVVANQMKLLYKDWNDSNVDDFTIFKELYELSNGRIELREGEHKLEGRSSNSTHHSKGSTNKGKRSNYRRRKK